MGTGVPSLGVKRQGQEADHSPPSSAEIKNGGGISTLYDTSSKHGAYLCNTCITGAGSFLNTSVSPANYHSTKYSIFIHHPIIDITQSTYREHC
jgi:hypothetical protein